MPTRLTLSCCVTALLMLILGGCRTSPIVPYAWKPTAEDPRLLIRVPEGTEGSTPVPREERLHRNAWATEVGEIETPDPRWSCCPEESESEAYARNEVSLFLGFTGVRAGDGATVGLTYLRRLRRNFGVHVFGEYVLGDLQVPVVGAGVFFKPNEDATIFFALGREFKEEEDSNLFRFGASYIVREVKNLRLAPAIYMDILENEEPVFIIGLEIAREF